MKKQNNAITDNTGAGKQSAPVILGEFIGAHGVKGLVKINCFADDPYLIEQSPDYKITLKNKHKGQIWLAMVDGVPDKDAADALKKKTISLPADQLPSLDEKDGFYYHDLIGCTAYENDDAVGEVIAVENFGAGDLLEIKPEKGESFYLNFTDGTVHSVNTLQKRIDIILPEFI